MKKYIFTAALLFAFTSSNAQVIMNPDTGQAPSSPSVLLEFGSQPKGLLLPWVTNTSAVTGALAGTVVYDISDKKVKYLKGASWVDLSIDGSGVVDTTLQDTVNEAANATTIIGDRTSAAPGILVLESPTKAMVLPKMAQPYQNIVNPAAGMMVYDTAAKQLAVFNGTVWTFWKPGVEIVPTVTSATGRIWMDRNLGATQVATSPTDAAAFGDLYQWGRLADGHQLRTSGITNALSSSDVPGHADFIISQSGNNDWRSPSNDGLWQGINGANNPCPSGFRIPTDAEFQAEVALFSSLDANGAYASVLKLTTGALRTYYDGSVVNSQFGYYWTASAYPNIPYAFFQYFSTSGQGISNTVRSYGFSVRCIKN